MAVQSTDIQYRLSGGAANTEPASSTGGAKSSATLPEGLFDTVNGAEAAAGDVEYRCIYAHNGHASQTLIGAVAWIQSDTPGASTTIAIGLGSSAVNGTEPAAAGEDAAPAGVTFSAAASKAAGINLGNLGPGESRAIWLRRTVTAGAPASAQNQFTIRVEGDTEA